MGKNAKKSHQEYIPWIGLNTGWDKDGQCFIQFVDTNGYDHSFRMKPKMAEKLADYLVKMAKKARKEKK